MNKKHTPLKLSILYAFLLVIYQWSSYPALTLGENLKTSAWILLLCAPMVACVWWATPREMP